LWEDVLPREERAGPLEDLDLRRLDAALLARPNQLSAFL
jgi:hypothetical protein